VLAIARNATLTKYGGFVYSNLGVALLGHALAAAARMDYAQMLQERVFTPLGMTESSLPLTVENLPAGEPTGYSAAGIAEAPWAIDGWAPAGGARSTAADMARYAQALLDGSAPGMEGELVAGDPVQPADRVSAPRVEAFEAAQRGRERLGEKVGRRLGITGAANEEAGQWPGVPAVELRERVGVTPRGQQERFVAAAAHALHLPPAGASVTRTPAARSSGSGRRTSAPSA